MSKNISKALLTISLFATFLLVRCSSDADSMITHYMDYQKGLQHAQEQNQNILLIFDRWGSSHAKFAEYLTERKIKRILQGEVVIFLMVDDDAIYNDTLTVGEYNSQIQKKYQSSEVPDVLIIDQNENIIKEPKGYLPYKQFETFIDILK